MNEKLACGHTAEIAVGTELYNHYDCAFGEVVRVDVTEGWHTVRSHGGPYWPQGRDALLNWERLACVACGERSISDRHHGTVAPDRSWAVLR